MCPLNLLEQMCPLFATDLALDRPPSSPAKYATEQQQKHRATKLRVRLRQRTARAGATGEDEHAVGRLRPRGGRKRDREWGSWLRVLQTHNADVVPHRRSARLCCTCALHARSAAWGAWPPRDRRADCRGATRETDITPRVLGSAHRPRRRTAGPAALLRAALVTDLLLARLRSHHSLCWPCRLQVRFSPYKPTLLACSAAQYYGIVGNGRLYVLDCDPMSQVITPVAM